jgi:hypothetical protein
MRGETVLRERRDERDGKPTHTMNQSIIHTITQLGLGKISGVDDPKLRGTWKGGERGVERREEREDKKRMQKRQRESACLLLMLRGVRGEGDEKKGGVFAPAPFF